MLTKMRNILSVNWGQAFKSATSWLPVLSAAEQTRATWARSIDTHDAVPEVYKVFFEPLLAEGKEFPYTVLAPSYEGFIHRTTEKLVCDLGKEIHVLERNGDMFEAQCFPINKISYMEVRTILLDSRIKITGVTSKGVPASTIIKFNTVTDYLFTPILKRIRRAAVDSRDTSRSSESDKFDYLVRTNYKFMNYGKHSLLAGDKVHQIILQPEIRTQVLTVLGRTFFRTISPAHLTILTDRELISIREDEKLYGEDKYGGIWDYIPLTKVSALSISGKDRDLLVLTVQLAESTRLEFLFQVSAKQEIDKLLVKAKELTLR